MTRKDIAARIAGQADISPITAYEAVGIILESIVEGLQQGEDLEVRGFGAFRVKRRRPRPARNPLTGESVQVPAKSVVRFKPGRILLDLVNDRKSGGRF